MASGDNRSQPASTLTGKGLRIGVVRAEWNAELVNRLVEGIRRTLGDLGAVTVGPVSVAGCFELPMACKALATSGSVDALVVAGVVIRGETTHYELVSEGTASGIQAVQLETGIPIGFGVLTVESVDQALERSQGPGEYNVGAEAAQVSIEMARLVEAWR